MILDAFLLTSEDVLIALPRKCFSFPSRGLTNSKLCLLEATEGPDLLVQVPFLHSAAEVTWSVTQTGLSFSKDTTRVETSGSLLKTSHCSGFSAMKALGHTSNTHAPKQPLSPTL